MVYLKTDDELELLRASNDLVGKTLAEVAKYIKPGVSTKQLDTIAEEFIRDNGAIPTFKGYPNQNRVPFSGSICTSVNDVVVHGFPSDYKLKEGDIVSVDCGTVYKGYYGDSAYTFPVGEVDEETARLLKVTKESLYLGIEKAVAGNRIGDIGHAVQSYTESFGFSVVREMVGHGIGRDMHEHPEVPNYGKAGTGKKLLKGMTICIEPMINAGGKSIYLHENGWAVSTCDKKNSAHFELTVAVGDGKADILSTFDFIEGKRQY